MSHLLASRMSQLSYEGEECQKNFTSHEEKVPAQDVAALPRGLAAAVVQPEALPPTKPGTIQMTLQNFPQRKTQKGREGRGANTVSRAESPLTRGPSCTRPPNLTVCPQASVFPSLGLHKMKMEPHYLCAGRQAGRQARMHRPLCPRLHLITLDALLIIPKYPTPTATQPPSPAVRLISNRFASCLEYVADHVHNAPRLRTLHIKSLLRLILQNPSKIILSKLK